MNSRIYFGPQNGSPPPAEDKTVFEPMITLDADQVADKEVTLSQTPVNVQNILALVVGGSVLDNISLSGNVVNFSASSYAATLVVGDQLKFVYKKV